MSNMKKTVKKYAWYMDDIYQGLDHLDDRRTDHIVIESRNKSDKEGYYIIFKSESEIRYRHFNILENRYLKNYGIKMYRELPSFVDCTFKTAASQPRLYEEGLQEFGLGAIELSA